MAESSPPKPPPENPEDSPKQPWSAAEYKRIVAERKANRTPEEKAQDDADAASNLRRAAQQLGLGQPTASDVFKRTIDEMHKASIDGARRARAQRKADMEEAFDNALRKSGGRARSEHKHSAVVDEIQEILSQEHLWNWEFSYNEVGQSYSSRRLDHVWEKLGERDNKELIATAVLPVLAAVATGVIAGVSWQNFITGMAAGIGAGAVTLIVTFCVIFILHWLAAPKELDADIRGDLEAARKQVAEEKQKVRRIAAIARDDRKQLEDKLYEETHSRDLRFNETERERHKLAQQVETLSVERDALHSRLAKLERHNLVFEMDWGRCQVEAAINPKYNLVAIKTLFPLRFEKRYEPSVMGKKLDIELYEQGESEPTRINTRAEGMRLEAGWPLTTVPFVGMKFTEPLSDFYQLRSQTIVYAPINAVSDLESGKHFLRFTMEASNQDPLSVDIDVDWQEPFSAISERR